MNRKSSGRSLRWQVSADLIQLGVTIDGVQGHLRPAAFRALERRAVERGLVIAVRLQQVEGDKPAVSNWADCQQGQAVGAEGVGPGRVAGKLEHGGRVAQRPASAGSARWVAHPGAASNVSLWAGKYGQAILWTIDAVAL
jgi:hypothetical protein